MTNKKQVFLSLETAKQMWKDSKLNSSLIDFLLDNFTKEELEAKELPKTWEQLNEVNGFFINTQSNIGAANRVPTSYQSKNTFPTKELAEASLALSQLLQLRDVYNGDWKIDLNDRPVEVLYTIRNRYNDIHLSFYSGNNYILAFQKESIRDQFAENFKDLIIQALPLL